MTPPSTVDAIDAIKTRRSTRRGFIDQRLPAEDIETIVECGLAAPSSKDAQPWRLHVVEEQETRQAIADAMLDDARIDRYVPIEPATGAPSSDLASSVRESAQAVADAPLSLFVESLNVFGSRLALAGMASDDLGEALVGYGFEYLGLGAAIENMWLAANALGYGAVFIGDVVIAEQTVQRLLGFTGDLVGVVVIGSAARGQPRTRAKMEGRAVFHQAG